VSDAWDGIQDFFEPAAEIPARHTRKEDVLAAFELEDSELWRIAHRAREPQRSSSTAQLNARRSLSDFSRLGNFVRFSIRTSGSSDMWGRGPWQPPRQPHPRRWRSQRSCFRSAAAVTRCTDRPRAVAEYLVERSDPRRR